MSFLDIVHAKRQKLADVLSDEDYSGIREIVEELYPDQAHFIYELLQNAEDAGASEACFVLAEDALRFEHNGRTFSEDDVWGITNIGKGTKREQEDKIGRFGVGFKAVFAYSETPRIWSPTFSFKITELVLPSALDPAPDLGNRTRFEFPFNNSKKDAGSAFAEVEAGLSELAEMTLLFLSHLESISWQIGETIAGVALRIQHSENHFEVLKQSAGKTTTNSHFLKLERAVEGLEKQRVAVAFALDFLPSVEQFDPRKPLAKQLKIIPAAPGKVAVFFPAEKETSGLRFHLHGPFVPELSRASIKETPANQPLFLQLASLTAASLHQIRDLGLLTAEFLAVLPNPQDPIPTRYQVIRTAIIEEMNSQPLTPTHAKSHAPAKHLLQAKASLKELLSEDDIELLVDYDENPPQWAIGAAQKNSNVDRFLVGLDIGQWDVPQFVEMLCNKATSHGLGPPNNISTQDVMTWLTGKPLDWHQELYSLLFSDYLSGTGSQSAQVTKLQSLQIVRLSDGNYHVGSRCYFPSVGVEVDEELPYVDAGVYTSGKSRTQQENARKFLEVIRVREVGEADLVAAILKRRYRSDAFAPNKEDIKCFIALLEKDPTKAALFAEFWIFELKDGKWGKPNQVFLDHPFMDTELSAYYEALGKEAQSFALAERYQDCDISIERLAKFAAAVGAKTFLQPIMTTCYLNPDFPYLMSVGGDRWTSPIDRDWVIPQFKELLAKPSVTTSKLIWKTMCHSSPSCLQAIYQKNASRGCRKADSQLVHHLRKAAWVPQGGESLVRPAEAFRELLPGGFPSDPDWPWFKALHFGEEIKKNSEAQFQKHTPAKVDAKIARAMRFMALSPEVQERILADQERREHPNLPEHEPANPTRRAERVGDQAADAPERLTEERTRSVSIDREAVKQKAEQYLRQQYSRIDGDMICQVCQKVPLPFKLDNGNDYFEKVELLPTLKKRHYQNYLALCPNHAAMFQHAHGSAEVMQERLIELMENELEAVLAQKDVTIYFTKTHIADLKAVIEADHD